MSLPQQDAFNLGHTYPTYKKT